MFLKHLGFFALPITNGFNFSPVLLHVNNTVTRSFANFPPLQASPFTPSVLSGSKFSIGFFKICGESADVD
jgi:hypothetical protein